MNRRRVLIGAAGAVALLGGVALWRTSVVRAQSARRETLVTKLLHDGRAAEALGLLQRTQSAPPAPRIAALADLGDTAALASLWRLNPAAFAHDERASLLAARGLVQARDNDAAQSLAARWKKRTAHPAWWFCLDIDQRLAQRKNDGARHALEGARFAGADDAARLMRLALLCDTRTPAGLQRAWELLRRAYTIAPKDPDVRAFRGQILERLGKTGAARVEYVAAHVAAPHSAFQADQLGEFYRRRGRYDLAVETWTLAQASSPSDLLAARAAFWGRVATPGPAAELPPVPPGPLQPLARWLRGLPDDAFFEETTFDALPDASLYAKSRPEVLWLRVAEALRTGHDEQALSLLKDRSPAADDWNPALARTLTVLIDRRHGRTPKVALTRGDAARHPLLAALASGARTPELDRLIRGPEALPAAFLACGWWGVAARLAPAADSAGLPDWYAFGIAEALRTCRGPQAALAWARRQGKPSPALRLTIAELQIAADDNAGVDGLQALVAEPGPAGDRAACLLALAALERKDPAAAEALLRRRPALSARPTGIELRAQVALLRGDRNAAAALYRSVAPVSLEAQVFLARDAFSRGQWDTAERWTRLALARDPDLLTLQDNLAQIDAARRKARS